MVSQADSLTQDEVSRLCGIYLKSHRAFAEDAHVISSEQAGIIPLKFSESQQFFDPIVTKLIELNLPIWVRHLKARQVYASTYWMSVAHWLHWLSDGPRRTCVFAPDYKKSENLYNMMLRYEQYLPKHLKKKYKTKTANKYAESGAYFEMLSAGSDDPLRSGTYQGLIWTEVPFTANAAKAALGAKPSIMAQPLSLYIQETTPNGFDPYFQPAWMDDMDRVAFWCKKYGARDQYDLLLNHHFWDGTHFPIFTPWYWMLKYVANPALVDLTEGSLSGLEQVYAKQYGLTLPQLAWRREQIYDIQKSRDYRDDSDAVRWFMQEYPADPNEAFKASGGPVFTPIDTVTAMREESRKYEIKAVKCEVDWQPKHKPQFTLDGLTLTNRDKLRATAYKNEYADFLLYALPKPGYYNRYVIGADVAEGLAQGDYSVAYVLDRVGVDEHDCKKCDEFGMLSGDRCIYCGGSKRIPFKPELNIVMQFRAHIDEHRFGRVLAAMGTMYHNAWILPERNNTGKAAILELQKYYTNVLSEVAFNSGVEKDVDRLGIYTTDANKPVLIADFKSFIMKNPRACKFVQPWIEMQSFTRNKKGQMGAEGKRLDPSVKNYDDCVMALCHTYRAHLLAPLPTRDAGYNIPEWARRDSEGTEYVDESGNLGDTWEKVMA